MATLPVADLIAFGSCRKQKYAQDVWDAVARLRPSAWLWTGDYLYFKAPRGREAAALEASFVETRESAGEQQLRAVVPIIDGVYDDHDYGENDAGRHFANRELARRLFLDEVVRAPETSARRTQDGGLYGARTLVMAGREVKVLMLDTRFSRDDHAIPSLGGSTWLPKPGYVAAAVRLLSAMLGLASDGDVLGEAQWAWLEGELSNSSASVHVLISSIQARAALLTLHTTEPLPLPNTEHWYWTSF